jgi:hypothetical protein
MAGRSHRPTSRTGVLTVKGTTLTGTVTHVTAAWTAGWGWTHARRPSVLVDLSAADSSYLPGLEASYDEFVVSGTYSETFRLSVRVGTSARR